MNKIILYLKSVQAEMAKVSWPNRDEVLSMTTLVVLFSLLLSIVVKIFDLVLSRILNIFLNV